MKKNEYDCIFSIGRDCCCASYLLWHGLRKYSGPFDWITNAQWEDCAKLICNDLNDFINPEDLEPLSKRADMFNDDKCDYYRNKRTHYAYFHDFPAGVPVEKSYEAVKEKYLRRIERFNLFLKYSERPLLIWMCHNTKTSDEDILKHCRDICAKYGNKVQFCFVEHDHDGIYCKNENDIKIYNPAPNITIVRAHIRFLDEHGIPLVFGKKEQYDRIIKLLNISFKMPHPLLLYIRSKIQTGDKKKYCQELFHILYASKKHLTFSFFGLRLSFRIRG